jgi:hypothetical protein
VAIGFFLIGAIILLFDDNRLGGIPFIVIGLFEIIKYPTREKRWVKKKEKQGIFDKNLEFKILNDRLNIHWDKEEKSHLFSSMRKCLISDTGILFKVSWTEYYYISFKSLDSNVNEADLIDLLNKGFEKNKIIVKRTHNIT